MKKITAMKLQKRRKDRVNVYLEDEFAFGLSKIVAGWLKIGQVLSEQKIQELLAKDEVEVGLQKALNFISYRSRSEKEVKQNLVKHGASEIVIEEVCERLRKNRLLDDPVFAEQWVENRSAFRPRGRRALRYELMQKGIADEIIEEALQELDEEQLAYRAAAKQARKYRHLDWQDFRKKLNGFLARRGFQYAIISIIIPKVWDETISQT